MNKTKTIPPSFFFDTADTEAIQRIWDKLGKKLPSQSCVGITTNPNALAKVNCHTLIDLERLVKTMSSTMDGICGGGSLIYVQVPNSCMSISQVIKWADFIRRLETGKSKIALKIPHFSYILRGTNRSVLENSEMFEAFKNLYLNVTGVSDAGTIIKALNYENVAYASIIPGRMEEVGIDANAHLKYLCEQKFKSHQAVITGSMRTIRGLKDSIYYRTVPTIGTRIWDLVAAENLWDELPTYWENVYHYDDTASSDYSPQTTETNINLSKQFFEQMDSLGSKIHQEFLLH